jgi:hypothetical protein
MATVLRILAILALATLSATTPDLVVPALRGALAQNRDATVVELAGLNHCFQRAGSGSPKEFGTIEETLAPEVVTTLTDWLATHAK